MEFVQECKSDPRKRFVWEYKDHGQDKGLYKKIEKVDFKKLRTKRGGYWYDVNDYMLVSGCFQVPIFIYQIGEKPAYTA